MLARTEESGRRLRSHSSGLGPELSAFCWAQLGVDGFGDIRRFTEEHGIVARKGDAPSATLRHLPSFNHHITFDDEPGFAGPQGRTRNSAGGASAAYGREIESAPNPKRIEVEAMLKALASPISNGRSSRTGHHKRRVSRGSMVAKRTFVTGYRLGTWSRSSRMGSGLRRYTSRTSIPARAIHQVAGGVGPRPCRAPGRRRRNLRQTTQPFA